MLQSIDMGRKTRFAYAAVQALGVCAWLWPQILTQSTIGPWLSAGSFLLLMPGDLMGEYLIRKFLWMKGLTLMLWVALALGINLAVWASGAWAWRRLFARKARVKSA